MYKRTCRLSNMLVFAVSIFSLMSFQTVKPMLKKRNAQWERVHPKPDSSGVIFNYSNFRIINLMMLAKAVVDSWNAVQEIETENEKETRKEVEEEIKTVEQPRASLGREASWKLIKLREELRQLYDRVFKYWGRDGKVYAFINSNPRTLNKEEKMIARNELTAVEQALKILSEIGGDFKEKVCEVEAHYKETIERILQPHQETKWKYTVNMCEKIALQLEVIKAQLKLVLTRWASSVSEKKKN